MVEGGGCSRVGFRRRMRRIIVEERRRGHLVRHRAAQHSLRDVPLGPVRLRRRPRPRRACARTTKTPSVTARVAPVRAPAVRFTAPAAAARAGGARTGLEEALGVEEIVALPVDAPRGQLLPAQRHLVTPVPRPKHRADLRRGPLSLVQVRRRARALRGAVRTPKIPPMPLYDIAPPLLFLEPGTFGTWMRCW